VGLFSGFFYIASGGLNWVGVFDAIVNGTWGIALLGLLECLVIGWYYRLDILRQHSNDRSDWRLGKWWDITIRLVLPIVLGMLFFWNLYDDITAGGGVFSDSEGNFAIDKLVMSLVTLTVFVGSIVITSIKTKDADNTHSYKYSRSDRYDDNMPLRFAVSFAVAVAGIWFLFTDSDAPFATGVFIVAVAFGTAIIFVSSKYVEDNYRSEKLPHFMYGNCGALCCIGVSAALTGLVVRVSRAVLDGEIESRAIAEELSGVSYIILSVVFIIIVVGLGWSFYKVLTAASGDKQTQEEETV